MSGYAYRPSGNPLKKKEEPTKIVLVQQSQNLDHHHDNRYYTETEIDDKLVLKADLVSGKVPASQLPSYVDDVLEFPTLLDFPVTGEQGKIYVAVDTNYTYRYTTSSGYILVGDGGVIGPVSSTDNAIVRFDSTTGKVIQNSTVTIDDNGNTTGVNSLGFDTTPTTHTLLEGELMWNTTDGTLDLGMNGGDIKLQIGQENFIKVRNSTGSTIDNGTVVYFNGSLGNRPTIAKARSDVSGTSMIQGILTQDIGNNADGFITTSGYVRQIKTNYTGSGIWGTTWVEGDLLYVSKTDAGVLTNVQPSAPHHSDIVGTVGVIGAAGTGSILVNIDRHKTLEDLSDVNGTALTTTGQIPVWNQTAGYFDFTSNINDKLDKNTAITGATKTKITYDSDGLVTAGADATTADIADSTNKRYVTDAQLTVIGNTSGANTGDETTSSIQTKRPLKTIEGQSIEGTGNIDLSKSDVGLSNVDNTSDVNKPISTATQTALGTKQNTLIAGTNIAIVGNTISASGGGGVTNLTYTPSTTNGIVNSDTGTDATIPLVGTDAGLMSPSDKTKLNAITGTNTGDVTLSGTPDYLTIVGQAITRALINLTSHVTGTLPVANGGTGVTSSTGTGNNVLSTSPTLVTPILGTPTSGTLTNCTGLPVSGIASSTASPLGVGTIELGHDTDTTISRSSAGVIAVEGVVLPTISSTNTLTNKTIALGSNTVSGTKAQFDTACTDDNFAFLGQANTYTALQTFNDNIVRSASANSRIIIDRSTVTDYARLMLQSGGLDQRGIGLRGDSGGNSDLIFRNEAAGASNIIEISQDGSIIINGTIGEFVDTNKILFSSDKRIREDSSDGEVLEIRQNAAQSKPGVKVTDQTGATKYEYLMNQGRVNINGVGDIVGTGSPEGVITAIPGSIFKSDTGNLYRKSTGTGSTGWTLVGGASYASGTTTRTTAQATGTQTIAHGLGSVPKIVKFMFVNNSDVSSTGGVGQGNYNGTTNSCLGLIDLGASAGRALNTSNCIIYENSSGVGWRATATFDATNITLSRTRGGAGTNIDVMWEAYS